MNYEKPYMEVTLIDVNDIVCISQLTGEQGGNGDNIGGDGTSPWE